jgi:DNA-directed RNA polymerase subunit RPC12/RpoP
MKGQENTDKKVVLERHVCLNCGQINSLIVIDQKNPLSKKAQKSIKEEGIVVIKKGNTFTCPHCHHKVVVE